MKREEIKDIIGVLYGLMEPGELKLKCIEATPGINALLDILASGWYPKDLVKERIVYTLEDLLVLGHVLNLIETSEELEIALEEILEHKEARKNWIHRLNKYRKDKRRDKVLQRYENVLNTILSRWRMDIKIPWTKVPVPAVVFVDALRTLNKDSRTVKKSLLEFESLGLIKIKACTSLNLDSCTDLSTLARELTKTFHQARNKKKAEEEISRILINTGLSEVSPSLLAKTLDILKEKDRSLEEKYQLLLDEMITAISTSKVYSPTTLIELLILPLQTTEKALDEATIKEIIRDIYRSRNVPPEE